METVEGALESIVFQSEDDSYCVLRMRGKGVGRFTAVYRGPAPNEGVSLRLTGEWGEHPRYGQQFFVSELTVVAVTKVRRRRRKAVAASPELVNYLEDHGLSGVYAEKIEKVYKDDALKLIQENPYQLIMDVRGIGFKIADRLALSMGVEHNAAGRIQAGILYVLGAVSTEGHVCIPEEELLHRACRELGCEAVDVSPVYQQMVEDDWVRTEHLGGYTFVYSCELYDAEVGTAQMLRNLRDSVQPIGGVDADGVIRQWEKQAQITLAEEQRQAIHASLAHGVLVLTGGPGTGKTTVVKGIMNVLSKAGCSIALTAPTGRAARRLAESCGQSASTVHRLLEYRPMDNDYHDYVFGKNEDEPLDVDAVIVDEASMLDLYLTYSLLRAVPNGCRVIFVGDVDQLPSVGAGSVLKDMIASQKLPVVRLNNIFRQAEVSPIVTNAHIINQGRNPVFKGGTDFDLREFADEESGAEFVAQVYANAVARTDWRSVQVLSPMHRSPCGVDNLNKLLQNTMNPPTADKPQITVFGNVMRVGDKVMQIRNNYEKEVFNGDIGKIVEINGKDVYVDFPDRLEGERVKYTSVETEELQLAYAMSVHKSQGSEYPFVILLMVPGHYIMLQRNLLYTAITRAKQRVLVVGAMRAVRQAVVNNRTRNRYSLLKQRLQGLGDYFA